MIGFGRVNSEEADGWSVMKICLFCVVAFIGCLALGLFIQFVFDLIKKPYHQESRTGNELYRVTVYSYSLGRGNPGGRWTGYSFRKVKRRWKYEIDKTEVFIFLAIVMLVIVASVVVGVKSGYSLMYALQFIFVFITGFTGICLSGPLKAYGYVLSMLGERKRKK